MRAAIAALVLGALAAAEPAVADQPVVGTRLKDGRGVIFLSRDPAIVPPAAGGPDDPRNPNADWTFTLGSPSPFYQLESGNWIAGKDGTRFKYAEKNAAAAVRKAVIKPGLVKVQVKYGDVPHLPGVPVVVTVGGGATRWCAVFEPDTWVRDDGRFVARDAPAPAACPSFGTTTTTPTTVTTTTSVTSTTLLLQCTGGDPFPLCGGACPAGSVCAPDFDSFALCKCIFDTAPCGETYPVCGGVCGNGGTCRQTGTVPFGSCTCEPPGTLCTDGPYPTCGGACGAGTSCFPVIVNLLGQALSECQCGDTAPCGAGGLACPPGHSCANAGGTSICVPS